jgi:cyclomaltodextrinase
MAAMTEPDWVEHAIWWQVYPLGFAGADVHRMYDSPDTGGLRRLADWLDYAQRLGVSGLALGPVFESATHGYDTVDPFRIDARLGSDADFDALVEAAHGRGLRILLDGVFNHVGTGFAPFRRALADPGAPEAAWFRIDRSGAEPTWADFEGHHDLVALDHDAPGVADLVVDVMTHWLGRGADGWRLDAAYAVPDAFWASVLPRVRQRYPAAYLLGEVIHGDYAGTVRRSGLDSLTQYELWKAVWSSLNDGNLFELAHALQRHQDLLDTFVPLTFVGNHDVTRIASRLDDVRHLAHALVVLFTVAGTPSVYYGDEQAFRGVKEDRAGGDDDVRPAFPATAAALAPDGAATFRLHQDLIGLRRRHPWLHRARTTVLDLANRRLVYRVCAGGDDALVVALNLADAAVDRSGHGELLAGSPGAAVRDGTLQLPGHGWAVTAS